jgi:hypothetical protein
MSDQFSGTHIYAVLPAGDIRVYLERHAGDGRPVDTDASLRTYQQRVRETLDGMYPGARILVRLHDESAPGEHRTRVECNTASVDAGLIEQEVIDLIAEFDVTRCVVYR